MTVPPHSAPGNLSQPRRRRPCTHGGCTENSTYRGQAVYRCADGHLTCAVCDEDIRGGAGNGYVCETGCDHW